jgi:hypothetical protein
MKRLIEKMVFSGFVMPGAWRAPDEPLAVLRERDDRRRRAAALGVGDDDGSPPSMTATPSSSCRGRCRVPHRARPLVPEQGKMKAKGLSAPAAHSAD